MEMVVFEVLAAARGWLLTKNGRPVSHYPSQKTAERAMARHGRSEAKRGNQAKGIVHRVDGTIALERCYKRLSTPWLGNR